MQTNQARAPRGKEEIRRSNLSAALAIVRDRGPLSRSELVETLGLGRTTVFELLAHLSELGLTADAEPTSTGVGRPSLVVQASRSVGAYVVNPEVHALTVGICTLDGRLDTRSHPWTPLPPAQTADLTARLLSELESDLAPARIAGVGGGIPGQIDARSRRVISAPSLGWEQVDFAAVLADRLNLPSFIDNNARLVAATHLRDGAGSDYSDFIYLLANTGGIGGGIVSGGRLLVGSRGFAGEVGHLHITGRDAEGSMESLIRRVDLVSALGAGDPDDEQLDALVATSRDPAVRAVAERQLATLGLAVANLVNALDVRLVLLGGFLGSLYRRFPDLLDERLRAFALPAVLEGLQILPTAHTADGVLRGAAELVFTDVVADPLAWATG